MSLPITPERLRAHVVRLAGKIGDRNVFRPAALAAAADYIAGPWRGQGYRVVRQEFQASGVTCANLEVSGPAGRRPAGSSCSARITIRCPTAPPPTTMAAASRRCSSWRAASPS